MKGAAQLCAYAAEARSSGFFAAWPASLALTLSMASPSVGASGAVPDSAQQRVEARSADLVAVGIVRGDRMVIHVSRLLDNAPIRDAALTVLLRGVAHPTTAEADGSYTLKTHDLALNGPASLVFQIEQGESHEALRGTLQGGQTAVKPEDKNSARQLGWWVLNFGVCNGFRILISRRRKTQAKA